MRKLIVVLFLFCFYTSCFASTEERSELKETDTVIEDSQKKLLEILDKNENDNIALEILQESSEQYIQRNEVIKQEKKKQKKVNKYVFYIPVSINMSFTFKEGSFYSIFDKSVPVGISFGLLNAFQGWSFKGTYDFTFYKSLEKPAGAFLLSFGRAPIHTDSLFFGYYLTFCTIENIGLYSYCSIGASGTFIANFTKKMGLYFNFDATYRFGEKYDKKDLVDSKLSFINKTWRFSPTIGISLKMF